MTGLAQDIKQKITLDGEKEYNAALKEAQRNLKVLKSELKAETAELGKNATAQQKNETRVKNLQKQIKEQEKVVRTYEKALNEVKKKYGDNEAAIAKWEVKLNEARATLGNMKNSLDEVGNGMKNVGNSAQAGVIAANSFADSLGKIADVGGSISSAIEDAFSNIVGHITDAIGELWDQLYDVAARANAWTDLADYFGSTASQVQQWSNAIQGAGGNFNDFTTILNRFKTGGVNKKITEYFGVSDENYTNDLEYTVAVLGRMAELREEMTKGGTWDKALADIFGGRRSQAAGWFVSNWETITKNVKDFNAEEGGYGLTGQQLEDMNQLYINVSKLQTSWQALKDMALVHLTGDLALNVSGNLQAIVDAFKEYFQAEDQAGKDAAIAKIKDNIVEIFTNIKEAVDEGLKILDQLAEELKGSDDSTARALGEVLGKIVEALQWFTNPDNWEKVKKGFEAIIGVWAAGKVGSAVGNLASFAAHITTIKGAGRWLLGGASGAGAGAGAAATTSEITAAITASAGSIASAIAGMTMTVGVATIAFPALKALYDIVTGNEEGQKWIDMWNEGEKLTAETAKDPIGALKSVKSSDLRTALHHALGDTGYKEWGTVSGNIASDTTIPVRRTPNGNYYYIGANEDQQAAAHTWWDIYRENPNEAMFGGAFVDLANAFIDNEQVLDQLLALIELMEMKQKDNEFSSMEDLPAEWWTGTGSGNSLTSDDISGFRSVPGLMKAAVREGVSGIRVNLDGRAIGSLVAPYVSETIARDIG